MLDLIFSIKTLAILIVFAILLFLIVSEIRKIKNKNTSYFWDIAIRTKRGYLFSYYNFLDYIKSIYFFLFIEKNIKKNLKR